MCGIIAYRGRKDARKVIWQGLRSLEYRGYDSWGIGVASPNSIKLFKKVGKISESKLSSLSLPASQIGLGHTRWATHGRVTVRNAHPHLSQSGRLAVVHNGIVENFNSLKKELQDKGYHFKTETDTEVIANLIDYYYEDNSYHKAVQKAFKRLSGRNALVVYHRQSNVLIGVKKGSPLIFGRVGKKDFFIASDAVAFLRYESQVRYLADQEMIELTPTGFGFYNIDSREEIKPRLKLLKREYRSVSKKGYPHFMIKEIEEQGVTIERAVSQKKELLSQVGRKIKEAENVFLVGAGTASQVCHFGEYLFASFFKKRCYSLPSSEFSNFAPLITPRDRLLAVSQSGETADTQEAIRLAQDKGAKIISLVNVPNSTIDRISDYSLPTGAGVERAVASTKATTAQMALLTLLAFTSGGKFREGQKIVNELAQSTKEILNGRFGSQVKRTARKLSRAEHIYIIGRGLNFPIAREAAIKLQEVSYIHAQGFAGGELKHGPLALIEKGTPLIVLVDGATRTEIISNAQEVASRGGIIIGVGSKKEDVFDWWLPTPSLGILQAILNLIPIQLLAYYLAVIRGLDPDMPRNLAKSVTVK